MDNSTDEQVFSLTRKSVAVKKIKQQKLQWQRFLNYSCTGRLW